MDIIVLYSKVSSGCTLEKWMQILYRTLICPYILFCIWICRVVLVILTSKAIIN